MNTIIPCNNCGVTFEVTDIQQDFVLESKGKNMTFIMLECAECGLHTDFNPSSKAVESNEQNIVWRTPIQSVSGFVSLVKNNDENFYGCGETGHIWSTKEEFYSAIEDIIKKYPHRSKCYKKIEGEWFPNEEEPLNMDKIILENE